MSTKEQLTEIIGDADLSPEIKAMGQAVLAEEFAGDEVAQKMLKLQQILGGTAGGAMVGAVDEDQVKEIVRETITDEKISESDLDSSLQTKINNQPVQVQITAIQGAVKKQSTATLNASSQRPLVQKILSDVEARNNVYLYGGAGTGKTFMAQTISEILDWELIEISCNQFTSPLELVGGQTIDGYQQGKAIRAWGNLNEDGTPMAKKGCVLLLDELPKLDPNTAGILNALLSRVAEFNKGQAKEIQDGRGQKIRRGNLFVMATGNTLLNESNAEYEANFKQDLSLQDRFAGSTYEVFVDVAFEWTNILNKKWAFIYIYLNKLRRAIFEEGFQAKAFVSVRIMQSAQKTYQVFRAITDAPAGKAQFNVTSDPDTSFTPAFGSDGYYNALATLDQSKVKTLEDTMNEFYNLFTEDQVSKLKEVTDYEGFLRIIEEKNKLPLDSLNTASELEEVDEIIRTSPKN
jgi:cobaltochelatase CobS